MYRLKATVKCPLALADELETALNGAGVEHIIRERIPYGKFVTESRLYWDFVFPEMLSDEADVAYLSYEFEDSAEGRSRSHDMELKLGWIPQNLHYVTVDG